MPLAPLGALVFSGESAFKAALIGACLGKPLRRSAASNQLARYFSRPARQTRQLEFDHRAPRCRHPASNNYRAALGQMERRVLLAIDVLARRAIDRKDHLVATLRCA